MAEPIYYDVSSSNVESVAYDHETMELFVRFLPKGNSSGSHYLYRGVEPDTFSAFLDSPSKGQFVWQNLRNRYDYERLE